MLGRRGSFCSLSTGTPGESIMSPHFFRFIKTNFIIPPKFWGLKHRNTGSAELQFLPTDPETYMSNAFYLRGGYFSDDLIALKVHRRQQAEANKSTFEIWENSSDTWTRTLDVSGSEVTTSEGNGVFWTGTHTETDLFNSQHYNIADYATQYDSSNKILYVAARDETGVANDELGARTTSGYTELTQPWLTLYKTQKTGESWSDFSEIGILSASSIMYTSEAGRGVVTHFMTNDGTIVGRSQPPIYNNDGGANKQSKLNFFNPNVVENGALKKTDSVLWSNYKPDTTNQTTYYWGQQIGVNHDSTKVYAGGILSGSQMAFDGSEHIVRIVYDIIASGSTNGWEREAQITGSLNHAEDASAGQYISFSRGENSFAFNDDYAVMGMPSYKDSTASGTQKNMGAIHIYKKTGATWATHELIETINGSSSFASAGLDPNDGRSILSLYGYNVAINSDNDIAVTAPNYYVDATVNEGGAILVLTKSTGADTWGNSFKHLGITDAKKSGYDNGTDGDTYFRIQSFSNNYLFAVGPSGSASNNHQGIDILKKEEA